MATLCLLPISMSTSNRINKPGYEAYQPVLAARQLGLNQTSPRLIIHEKIQSRVDIAESLVATKAYSIFSNLELSVPNTMEFVYTTDGFNRWWNFWRPHLFHNAVASALLAINPEHETTPEEVISHLIRPSSCIVAS